MLEPVVDGALEQLRPACDPRIVDPIEETVLDINSPVSDRTNGNTQLSGQCLLRGEMQKPLAGLLSHFLRYVHGVDSVCVQKIHTTSSLIIKKARPHGGRAFYELVGTQGFEPWTDGLRVRCSTN